MRYMDMEPEQLRAEYWTERNGLAQVGDLACNVTSGGARRKLAGMTGAKLDRFDLICNVARKRGIDLLAATPEVPEMEPVFCPRCGTAGWEFTDDDQAECVNGHIWNQEPEIPGTFVRPGFPGDMNDPERFPAGPVMTGQEMPA